MAEDIPNFLQEFKMLYGIVCIDPIYLTSGGGGGGGGGG